MTNPDDEATTERERRLDDILGAYYEALEAGQSIEPAEWAARHPEFAPELSEFFAEQDRLHRLIHPMRPAEDVAQGVDTPTEPHAADPTSATPRLRYLGDYELLAEIDRGGMGIVYRARQRSLDRLVAVKMILPGRLLSDADLTRFRNEARVVANLDHPGIVPIYEVGTYGGLSYFSMKLMEGGSLADHIPAFPHDPRSAAGLVAQVARAVHYAHRRGVLHRDLKPSNILLDADGAPWVGDFGLARRFESTGESDPTLTLTGELLGSPSYMSPEQATGRRDAATTATDVYGLGAVLYALLAGRQPFRADSVVDTIAAVRRDDPEPPSRINPAVAPDLQAICLKCLEKHPDRRYGSAEALADDLDRFLAGEPTRARPPGPVACAGRWAARRRGLLGWAAAACLLLGLATLGLVLTHRLEQTRQVAQTHADEIGRRDQQARHTHYVDQIRLAAQLVRAGEGRQAREALDALRPERPDDDVRGFEWHYLRGLLAQERRSWAAHGGQEVYHVSFSPDGRTLATCGADATARLWDAATLAPRGVLRGHAGDVNALAFAPDGRTLATVGDDATLRFWDAEGAPLGPPLPALGTPPPVLDEPWATGVTFDHAGRRVFTVGADAKVRLWDAAARRPLEVVALRSRGWDLSLTPDDAQMAVAVDNNELAWYGLNGPGGAARLVPGDRGFWPDRTRSVVFSPDGRTLAATNDRNIELWDVATRRHRATLVGHLAVVHTLTFAPDGRTLASGDDAGTVRTWDVAASEPKRVLLGHLDRVWGCAFAPDGRTLATCGRDRTVKLWDVGMRPDRLALAGLPYSSDVAFRDAATLLVAETNGRVRTYDARTGTLLSATAIVADLPAFQCRTWLSRNGARIAATTRPGALVVRSLASPMKEARTLPGESDVSLSPDGTLFATRTADGQVVVRETDSLRLRGEVARPSLPLAIGPDGTLFAVLDLDRPEAAPLALIDLRSKRRVELVQPRSPGLIGRWNAISPDGGRIAMAADDASVVLHDGRTLARLAVLRGHAGKVHALAFSPDGRTLATGGEDGTVRLWHVESAQEVLTLDGHGIDLTELAFSPDGRRLATAGDLVVVWRAVDGPTAPDAVTSSR